MIFTPMLANYKPDHQVVKHRHCCGGLYTGTVTGAQLTVTGAPAVPTVTGALDRPDGHGRTRPPPRLRAPAAASTVTGARSLGMWTMLFNLQLQIELFNQEILLLLK